MTVALWAPRAASVDVVVGANRHPTERDDGGWFIADVVPTHGETYGFVVDGDPRPDPRGCWLPDGVHRPGTWYDHARFGWTDQGWSAPAWDRAVVYELHVGSFTDEGTFDSAMGHLPHLADLGVTHVELMPVAAFDGTSGWGYDGVAPWSVHEPYGGPDGLKRFVDAAHAHGLAVIIDVVHNHLGPSGNYLADYGPYFTDRVTTPWGDAVNLDGPGSDEVRAWLLGSVQAWLVDFHADGVRLDAVHELHDVRARTFLEELSSLVDGLAEQLGRALVCVAESDRNDPRTVLPRPSGLGMTAQWDDDVHHALHAWLTGEAQGYYADFAADAPRALRRVFAGAFFHAGEFSSFRGRVHGRPVDTGLLDGTRFVASLQTHDQVGNRAHGERLSHLVPTHRLAAGAALLLLGPFVPMLFMGEEWAASTPWQFFTSFPDEDLAQAVSKGRRSEFGDHGWSSVDVPDPQHPGTVEASRLRWRERSVEPHASMLAWYRTLLRLRASEPDLRDPSLPVELSVDAEQAAMRRGRFTVRAWLTGAPEPSVGDDEVVASFPGAVLVTRRTTGTSARG
jgi:maltooligosyltrehalose trehalohydrolase